MKIIGMIILLIGCFILWQHFELKKFRITSYEYQTDKITQSVNFAVVADLHAHVYGRDNDILIQKIKEIIQIEWKLINIVQDVIKKLYIKKKNKPNGFFSL